jgi:hypothetical protein
MAGLHLRLIETAATHAERIGGPTGTWGGVKFFPRVRLACGTRICEHHPRVKYPAPE